jgi:hypothetical protein
VNSKNDQYDNIVVPSGSVTGSLAIALPVQYYYFDFDS